MNSHYVYVAKGEVTCVICSRKFYAMVKNAKYCGYKCKRKGNNDAKQAKIKATRLALQNESNRKATN